MHAAFYTGPRRDDVLPPLAKFTEEQIAIIVRIFLMYYQNKRAVMLIKYHRYLAVSRYNEWETYSYGTRPLSKDSHMYSEYKRYQYSVSNIKHYTVNFRVHMASSLFLKNRGSIICSKNGAPISW